MIPDTNRPIEMPSPQRVITHITTGYTFQAGEACLYAICNDHTLWRMTADNIWEELLLPPQPFGGNEVATDDLDETRAALHEAHRVANVAGEERDVLQKSVEAFMRLFATIEQHLRERLAGFTTEGLSGVEAGERICEAITRLAQDRQSASHLAERIVEQRFVDANRRWANHANRYRVQPNVSRVIVEAHPHGEWVPFTDFAQLREMYARDCGTRPTEHMLPSDAGTMSEREMIAALVARGWMERKRAVSGVMVLIDLESPIMKEIV